ncbi:serine hydrolase domain-containing protein [Lysobacter enzymogenes]|uniref:serine hydrolase domain-containing protein n=1 Tax=Lysobacter enzymogenes TaxID=69 RepID=UPI0019D043E8|nr:serine hydrolase domain-containing protein [Lysobacter enzymogenes]
MRDPFRLLLCLCLCVATAAAAARAAERVADPAPDPALARVLARWDGDARADLRAVVVARDGAIVAERYYNGADAQSLHDIRSAGKSVTALLAGIAADQGRLRFEQPATRCLPDARGRALAGVRVSDLLSMRSGLDADDERAESPGNEDRLDQAADPVAFALSVPRREAPGTRYAYNSLTAYLAGLCVEGASGQPLDDFARQHLFAPLGIEQWRWQRDAGGHAKGQGNLSLRARDFARIGQMALDGGVWQGRAVVRADTLRAILAPRVRIAAADPYADDYGWFWYRRSQHIDGRAIEVVFASGNGGNKLYLVPALRLVVAIQSSAYGRGYGQRRSQDILRALLAAAAPGDGTATAR